VSSDEVYMRCGGKAPRILYIGAELEVSGQLQAPPVLPSGKESPVEGLGEAHSRSGRWWSQDEFPTHRATKRTQARPQSGTALSYSASRP
jgi:hypothetical protein